MLTGGQLLVPKVMVSPIVLNYYLWGSSIESCPFERFNVMPMSPKTKSGKKKMAPKPGAKGSKKTAKKK